MSKTIDSRVVQLAFENDTFERGVSQSLNSLNQLNSSINNFSKGTAFTGLDKAIHSIASSFTISGQASIRIIQRITDAVIDLGEKMIKHLVMPPSMTSGFQEYELKMNSIQTILASTGENLETVKAGLEELNKYSDETIYSFSDMTQNIGKFTNQGIKLKDAIGAIKGVSNAAALAGANAWEASRSMYNFSQAISTGYIRYIDWRSIENANMATQDFKQQLIETAIAMGTVTKNGNLYNTTTTNQRGSTAKNLPLMAMFNDGLQHQWLTVQVLTKVLNDYADATTEIGARATEAATRVTTFTKLISNLGEAMQSGWAMTHEAIFGDFKEATKLWTTVSKVIGLYIENVSKARNEGVKFWVEQGGRNDLLEIIINTVQTLVTILRTIKSAWREIFPPKTKETIVLLGRAILYLTTLLIPTEATLEKIRVVSVKFFRYIEVGINIIKTLILVAKQLVIYYLPAIQAGFIMAFSAMKTLLSGIKTVLTSIGAYILDVINIFQQITYIPLALDFIQERWGIFGRVIAQIAYTILSPISKIIHIMIDLVKVSQDIRTVSDAIFVMGRRWGTLGKVMTAIFYTIKNIVQGFAYFVITLTKVIFATIKLYNEFGNMEKVLVEIEKRFGTFGVIYAKVFRSLQRYISNIAKGFTIIRTAIGTFFTNLGEAFRILREFRTIDGSLESIERHFGMLGWIFAELYRPVYNAIRELSTFFNFLGLLMNEVLDAIARWWSTSWFTEIISQMMRGLQAFGDWVYSWVTWVGNGIRAIAGAIYMLGSAIGQFASDAAFLASLTPHLGTVEGALMMIENRLGTFGKVFVIVYKLFEPIINVMVGLFGRLRDATLRVTDAFINNGFVAGVTQLNKEIKDLVFNNPIINFLRDLKNNIMAIGKDNPLIAFVSQFDNLFDLIVGIINAITKSFTSLKNDSLFVNVFKIIINAILSFNQRIMNIDFNKLNKVIASGIVGIINVLTVAGNTIAGLLNNIFKATSFREVVDSIADFITSIGTSIVNLFSALTGIQQTKLPDTSSLFERFLGFGRDLRNVSTEADRATGILGYLANGLRNIAIIISASFEATTSFLRVVTVGVVNFLRNLTLLDMIAAGIAVTFISLTYNISRLIGGLANIFGGAANVLQSTSKFIDTLSKRLAPIASGAVTIKAFIVLLIVLTLSILALSKVPVGQLVKAVLAIGLIMGILYMTISQIENYNPKNLLGLAAIILSISFGIRALTNSIAILGDLDYKQIGVGFLGIVASIAALSLAIWGLSKVDFKSLTGVAAAIIAIAVGVRILVPAIEDLGSLPFLNIITGIIGLVAAVAALLVPFILISQFANQSTLGVSVKAILALAVAVRIIGGAVATIANSDAPITGAIAFAASLGALTLAIMFLAANVTDKEMTSIGKGLMQLSLGLAAIMSSMILFTIIPLEAIGKALLAMAGALVILVGISVLAGKWEAFGKGITIVSNALLAFGKMAVYVGAGVALLAVGLFLLGTLGTIGMTGILAFAEIIGKNVWIFVQAAVAIGLIGVAVMALGKGLYELGKGLFVLNMNSHTAMRNLGLVVAAFIVMGLVMGKYADDMLVFAVALAGIAGAFWVLSLTLKKFKKYGVSNLVIIIASLLVFTAILSQNAKGVLLSAGLIIALAGAMYLLNMALAGTTLVMAAVVLAVGLAIVAFSILIYTLEQMDGERIGNNFVAIGRAIIQGLIDGITHFIPYLIGSVARAVNYVITGFRTGFDTHSPSKITTNIGNDVMQGLINGMDSRTGDIKNSIFSLGDKMKAWFSDALSGINPFAAVPANAAEFIPANFGEVEHYRALNDNLVETETSLKNTEIAAASLNTQLTSVSSNVSDLATKNSELAVSNNNVANSINALGTGTKDIIHDTKSYWKYLQESNNNYTESLGDNVQNMVLTRNKYSYFLREVLNSDSYILKERFNELNYFQKKMLDNYAYHIANKSDLENKLVNNEKTFFNKLRYNRTKYLDIPFNEYLQKMFHIPKDTRDNIRLGLEEFVNDVYQVNADIEQYISQTVHEMKKLDPTINIVEETIKLRKQLKAENKELMKDDKGLYQEQEKTMLDYFIDQDRMLANAPKSWRDMWDKLKKMYSDAKDMPSLLDRFRADTSPEAEALRQDSLFKKVLGWLGIPSDFIDNLNKETSKMKDEVTSGLNAEEEAKEAGKKTGKSFLDGLSEAVEDLDKKWSSTVYLATMKDKSMGKRRTFMVDMLTKYNDVLSVRNDLEKAIAEKKAERSLMSFGRNGYEAIRAINAEIDELEKKLRMVQQKSMSDINAQAMAQRLAEQEQLQKYHRAYSEKYEEYSYKKKLVGGKLPKEVIDALKAKYLEDPKAIYEIKKRNWDEEMKAEEKARKERMAKTNKGADKKAKPTVTKGEDPFKERDISLQESVSEGKEGTKGFVAVVKKEVNKLVPEINKSITGVAKQVEQVGTAFSNPKVNKDMANGVTNMVGTVKTEVVGKRGELLQIGEDISKGVADGMIQSKNLVANAAQILAQTAIDNSKTTLKENSPSEVFIEIGAFCAEGLSQGLSNPSALQTIQNGALSLSDSIANIFANVITDPIQNIILSITKSINSTILEISKKIENIKTDVSPTVNKSIVDQFQNSLPEIASLNPKITPIIDLTNVNAAANRLDQIFNNRIVDIGANISANKANFISKSLSANTIATNDALMNKKEPSSSQTTNNNLTLTMNNTVKTETDIRKLSGELNRLLIKYGYAKGKAL